MHDDLGLIASSAGKFTCLRKLSEKTGYKEVDVCNPVQALPLRREYCFSDGKLSTIQEVSNPQNDRIFSSKVQDIPEQLRSIPKRQRPASVMVWGGISANFWTNLIFVPSGVKICSKPNVNSF